MFRKLAVLVAAALLGFGPYCGASPAHAFGEDDHEDLTRTGLKVWGSAAWWAPSFLNEPAIEDINNEHYWMDKGSWKDWSNNGTQDEYHFDDCEFDKSISRINGPWPGLFPFSGGYAGAAYALRNESLFDVGDYFGRILHAAQDLYSHSNWVELGYPRDIANITVNDLVPFSHQGPISSSWNVPAGGALVAPDIILANDDWSPGPDYKVTRNGAGPFQSVLYDPRGKRVGRLLETGTGWADHECNIAGTGYDGFRHDDKEVLGVLLEDDGLNKDGPGYTVDSKLKFVKARQLAILQTAYEWCRLVAKAGEVDRDGLLLAMWVRPDSNPHPLGTPCGPSPATHSQHRLTVTVERVQILDTGDSPRKGDIQLSAALYDNPQSFHQSVHRQNRGGVMSLNMGEYVPPGQLPEPMTMCVSRSTMVHWAMHGWDNDSDPDFPPIPSYPQAYDDWGNDDELLLGGQTSFTSEATGVQNLRWEDLAVRIRISQGGAC